MSVLLNFWEKNDWNHLSSRDWPLEDLGYKFDSGLKLCRNKTFQTARNFLFVFSNCYYVSNIHSRQNCQFTWEKVFLILFVVVAWKKRPNFLWKPQEVVGSKPDWREDKWSVVVVVRSSEGTDSKIKAETSDCCDWTDRDTSSSAVLMKKHPLCVQQWGPWPGL